MAPAAAPVGRLAGQKGSGRRYGVAASIVSAGPAAEASTYPSSRELAARLGRSRQSLYYHLGLLEEAGLVVTEPPGSDSRERRYRLREGRLAVAARHDSPADRAAATRVLR